MHSIQYVRHLHDKVKSIDERTSPKLKEDTSAQDAATAAILGVPSMMMGDTLMITNGAPYGGTIV